VADFLETHSTECDNSAYNSAQFVFCSLRSQITFNPYFKAVFKGEELAALPPYGIFNFNVTILRTTV